MVIALTRRTAWAVPLLLAAWLAWVACPVQAQGLATRGPTAAAGSAPASGDSSPGDSSPSGDTWSHVDAEGRAVVHLWFGYSSACPHCRAALPFVAALDAEAWLEARWLQVDGPDAGEAIVKLEALARLVGEEWQAVPVFVAAGAMDVGWADAETTGARLRARLLAFRDALEGPDDGPASPASPDTSVVLPFGGSLEATSVSLPILAVVLGGLDAVNPCALAVLLFLLSVLADSHHRRRMLLIGGLFVAVTGTVTFALMVAWLNVFTILGALPWVTLVAGLAAVTVAAINLKDHVWFGRGVSLTMPASARPSVFGRIVAITGETRLRVLVGTTILVAAVADMYEMICTGGFSVAFTRVLTLQAVPTVASYAYVALYCLVYVLPMLLIVIGFSLTFAARGVSVREARDLKLLSGLLMLGFGGLLLLAPERISDLPVTLGLLLGAIGAWLAILVLERFREHRSSLPRHA